MQTFPSDTLPAPTRQSLIDSLRDLGWQTLRQAPAAGRPSLDGPLILAHPAHGIALLDLAPDNHGEVAGALRRRLESAGLETGGLPIIHRVLGPGDDWRLTGILDQAFAEAPALDPPDDDGTGKDWIGQVQHALRPEPPARPRYPALPVVRRQVARAGPLRLFWGGLLGCVGLAALVLQWLGPPPPPAPPPPAPAVQPQQATPQPAEPLRAVAAPARVQPPAPASGAPVAAPVAAPAAAPTGMPAEASPASLPLPPPEAPPLPATGAAQADEAPPEGSVALRVFVHHASGGSGSAAAAIAARAARFGGSVEIRPVPATPPMREVRYFRASDEVLAQRLAAALGGGWRLHDLTRFTPRPSPGTLEVWLSAEE
ncbi:hypothetical protein HB662_16520 [Roseomonas frigidaquae]|uniref:LytR/CpsA/Psr regulator C-terminal domain-containing protein n=1 Tax=Falsiroseomonas frigidaquae TaxID=487318 RepID=A0ABX1F228_9PROT|nr:hypothetical protein [Falsiroseomonas frigidaquae]NKE46388.1 hypothetical protein [Falsiroseomonas frigidaquae]